MEQEHFDNSMINKTIEDYQLDSPDNLIDFIVNNPLNLGSASLARIAELTNSKKREQCCILHKQVHSE